MKVLHANSEQLGHLHKDALVTSIATDGVALGCTYMQLDCFTHNSLLIGHECMLPSSLPPIACAAFLAT